jgi:hypothetical protein
MSRHFTALAALAAVTLLAVGCPGGGSKATPQETLQTMSSAMSDGNRDQFVACWKADANQKKSLELMFDMFSGPMKLKKAITKTYGADGWKKFQNATQMGRMMGQVPDAEDVAKAKVEIKGDQATATIPGQPMPTTLVKEGGSWLVDAKEIPQGGPPEEARKMMAPMGKAYDKVLGDVGKSGETPETLAKKLDTEMMSSMLPAGAGGPGMPPMPK